MKNLKKDTGFTLLIATIVVSLLLIISFAVVNVALKQLILSNYAQESQFAFYNAESGIECALHWDLRNPTNPGTSAFGATPRTISCSSNTTLPVGGVGPVNTFTVNFAPPGKGCVVVTVTKAGVSTTVDSKGYNTCSGSSNRRLERGITITY